MTHFVYIPFTGVGIGQRNTEWFQERIKIFKQYTLKSLANQTNKDFILWLSFSSKDEFNPLVTRLRWLIEEDAGFPPIFTFDGLMYHDDKFGGSITHRIWNAARLVRAAWRNNTWSELQYSLYQMLFENKNKTLPKRLAKSLEKIKPYIKDGIVLLTRIDSDDMFHKDALRKIREDGGSVVAMSGGYIYDIHSRKLAFYNPKTNPPFHTIGFSEEEFLDVRRHLFVYGPHFKSHEDVSKLHPHVLTERLYCVTTHNPKNHISTTFLHPYKGCDIVDEHKKRQILSLFGLCSPNAKTAKW